MKPIQSLLAEASPLPWPDDYIPYSNEEVDLACRAVNTLPDILAFLDDLGAIPKKMEARRYDLRRKLDGHAPD